MAVIKELIRAEQDGTLSFGDYTLDEKKKVSDFAFEDDLYKVKSFKEITKLEQNEMFVYESEPGTAVEKFEESDAEVSFVLWGSRDAQVTIGLEEEADYEVFLDGKSAGTVATNFSGKLTFSAELTEGTPVSVKIVKK